MTKITATLKVSIKDNSPVSLHKTPIKNILISLSPSRVLIYDCQERFMDLVLQYQSNVIAVGSLKQKDDLLIAMATQNFIEIASMVYSKVLYRIDIEKFDSIVGIAGLGGDLVLITGKRIELFSLNKRKRMKEVDIKMEICCYCEVFDDLGNEIYIGAGDGRVLRLNEDLEIENILDTKMDGMISLQVLNDFIAVFTNSGSLTLWSKSSLIRLTTLNYPDSVCFTMWLSPSSGLICLGFGCLDGNVHLFNQSTQSSITHKKSTLIKSICWVNENLLFSGDSIFKYSLKSG